jgi:hypothetical protein
LDTAKARLRLAVGKRTWVNLAAGVALGYRRGQHASTWLVRFYVGAKRYAIEVLAQADDHVQANGETILTYFQAANAARNRLIEWNRRRDIGGKRDFTVNDAVDHYLPWFRAHRKGIDTTERIINVHIRPTFGDALVSALKKKTITDWHSKIATTPARKRTKTGKPQAYQAAPKTEDAKRARRATANRALTVLKAILNKAAEDDLIAPRGPWVDAKPFMMADQPVERFLTTAESVRLLLLPA